MKYLPLFLSVLLLWSCNSSHSQVAQSTESVSTNKKQESAPVLSQDLMFDFDADEVGALPKNWSQFFTGRGKHTDWQVLQDGDNKVLAQLSQDHPNYHFNDIVYDDFLVKNMMLSVEMKGVKGRMDQGGGFIWRWQDKDNYYVVRANPLEDNVVLYKVKNGKRTDLPILGKGRTYGVDVPPLGNDWNTLKLEVKDDLFIVYMNCDEIFRVRDQTFTKAGKIGLWTKADAVTYFDELQVVVE